MANDLIKTRDAGQAQSLDANAPAFRLDLGRAFALHRGLAIAVGTLVFLLAIGYALTRKPAYEADAVLFVSPVSTDVLPKGSTPGFDGGHYDATLQQLTQAFTRQDTAEGAIRRLPPGVWRFPGETVQDAATRLTGSLGLTRMQNSFQMQASLLAPDANTAGQTLSAAVAELLRVTHEEQTGSSDEREQLLKDEDRKIAAELNKDRQEQNDLAASLGVGRILPDAPSPQDANVEELRRQLFDIRKARDMASAGILNNGGRGDNEAGGGGSSVTTSGLVYSLNTRKSVLQSQMAGMTPANPIYRQDENELRSIDKELSAAVRRSDTETVQRQARDRDRMVSSATDVESRVRGELKAESSAAAEAAPKLQRYSALASEIDRIQTRQGQVRDTLQSISLESKGPNPVRLVVPTSVSPAPAGKRKLVLLGSLPLAVIAGLFAALIAHRRDGRVYLPSDLGDVFGFAPMAVLPVQAEVSDALAAQSYLRLASSIENSYLTNRSRTFVFTAATPGTLIEDTVFQVQRALKDLGYSALWLGAEALLRAHEEFEHLYGRGQETVGIVPAGHAHEGYAVARLAWLKRDYDMILVDAPPLLVSAEAEYAVRRCDASILVSDSGKTTRDELQEAASILQRLGTEEVGVVLQEMKLANADAGYRHAVQQSEEQAAKVVRQDPVDDQGTWQVINAGTVDELHIPGDPELSRPKTKARMDAVRIHGNDSGSARKPGTPDPPVLQGNERTGE